AASTLSPGPPAPAIPLVFFPHYRRHRPLPSFPHDALPIFARRTLAVRSGIDRQPSRATSAPEEATTLGFTRTSSPWHAVAFGWSDRKSTRLNSSHRTMSYAVFCLKKKTTATPTYGC